MVSLKVVINIVKFTVRIRSYTVKKKGPFWPQKWGRNFDPEVALIEWGQFGPFKIGPILAPKIELNQLPIGAETARKIGLNILQNMCAVKNSRFHRADLAPL